MLMAKPLAVRSCFPGVNAIRHGIRVDGALRMLSMRKPLKIPSRFTDRPKLWAWTGAGEWGIAEGIAFLQKVRGILTAHMNRVDFSHPAEVHTFNPYNNGEVRPQTHQVLWT